MINGIKDIPVLKGKSATRFLKMNKENLENKGKIDFSKEFETYKKIMNKINIYILYYSCGTNELVTCYSKACDLCNKHEKMYYEEKEVTKDELYELINNSKFGNYIHISTVKPEGWISKEEYEYYSL